MPYLEFTVLHVNIYDGKYIYMKAPVSEKNTPLYEYTLMPMHMRNMFSPCRIREGRGSKWKLF